MSMNQHRQVKAFLLKKLQEYLRQDELEPFNVFVARYGFEHGFDVPSVRRLLENNFPPLTVEDNKVINPTRPKKFFIKEKSEGKQ